MHLGRLAPSNPKWWLFTSDDFVCFFNKVMVKFQPFVLNKVNSNWNLVLFLTCDSWEQGFLQVGCHVASHVIPEPRNTPPCAWRSGDKSCRYVWPDAKTTSNLECFFLAAKNLRPYRLPNTWWGSIWTPKTYLRHLKHLRRRYLED